METTIADYIGTTIGIHSPIPRTRQLVGWQRRESRRLGENGSESTTFQLLLQFKSFGVEGF